MADKEITLARIAAKMVDPDLEAQLAAAQAELETLRAIGHQLQPRNP